MPRTLPAAPLDAPRLAVRSVSWLESAGVALAAALVVAWAWSFVPAFTTDSDSYMDVADNLRHGLGLVQRVVDFTRPALPDPLGMWPPLYPVAVAGAAACGLPVDRAARAAAAVAYVAFMVALYRLASATVPGRYLAPVLVLVALRPTLVALSSTAWSEPLFLALLVWGVLAAIDLRPADTPAEVAARSHAMSFVRGLVLGLACLTRYVGLPVVAGLVALVLLGLIPGRAGLRKAAWTLGALGPPLAWMARNMFVFGRPFGPSIPPSGRSWHDVIGQALSALRWEFVPDVLSAHAATTLVFLALAAACGALAFARGGVARVLAYLAASHLAWTMLAVHESAVHDLSGRYMAPVYAFGIVIVADACLAGAARLRSRTFQGVTLAALVLVWAAWLLGEPDHRAGRAAQLDRAVRLAELTRLQGAAPGPVLSDAGHLLRTATGHSAVEIPTPFYAGRAFTRADRARWEAQGVQAAFLTRGSFAAGAFADWMAVDSTANFVRLVASSKRP